MCEQNSNIIIDFKLDTATVTEVFDAITVNESEVDQSKVHNSSYNS